MFLRLLSKLCPYIREVDEMLYLIRMSETDFWVRNDPDGVPCGSPFPSVAAHMAYEQADEICRRLNEQGRKAVVTNIYGEGVTLDDLQDNGTFVVGSVLRPGQYFIRWEKGRPVMTKQIELAFAGSRSIAEAVADHLKALNHRVEVLEIPRTAYDTLAYWKVMGNFYAEKDS